MAELPTTVVRSIEGPCGRADLVDLSPHAATRPDWAATMATWFLTCPGQSPAWSCYGLSTIHLREMPGVRPAVIHTLGATHEVLLIAFNPAERPVATDIGTWSFLLPPNVMHQVVLNDDFQAVELAELAARAVVNGTLWAEPPLSGQREPWATTLDITAAHLRTGGHHE